MNAIARISKNGVKGCVRFSETCAGVLIRAEICGLPRDGFFAFHIHEGCSCEEPGGHYNPTDQLHPQHAGDLPPLLSCCGNAYMEVKTNRFTLKEILGRALVIHNGTDDFKTQPSGAPGAILACGKIIRTA